MRLKTITKKCLIKMKLKVLSSSSEGNCYLLQSAGGDTLVLECGIEWRKILKGLQFTTKNVVGCLVSHEHNDHSKSVTDFLRYGINVFAHENVFVTKGRKSPFARIIKPRQKFEIGEFKIMALSAFHDVPCLCFVIEHEEMGKLLFATDTYNVPYKIKDINHIMVESNYCDDILDFNDCPKFMRDRLMLTHMEVSTTKKVIEQNMCDSLQTIILLHLSADNSSAYDMRKYILMSCGRPTYIAEQGFELTLDKDPY